MSNLQGTLSAGQAVGGNYEILGVAGSGGMGVVYRALDRRLNRTVALKFLPSELSSSPRDRERFLREARTASSLDHPNIGVIHAIEETSEGHGFIVMAFYDGQSLARRIREGPLSELDAVDIAIQMARGLAEAHSHHIIHRDIKPSNVMLNSSGAVRIVDFGLAQVTTQQTATSSGATGTINYMSPEQALEKGADHRTDIWSLGVTLAEMLTGRNPFEREGVSATLLSILNEPPRPMLGITPELQQIVYRALAKDVATRYQTMDELLAALEQVRPLLSGSAPLADAGSVTMGFPRSGGGSVKGTNRASIMATGTAQFRRAVLQASQSALPQLQHARARSSRLLLAAYLLGALVLVAVALLILTPVRERLAGIFLSSSQKHIVVLPFENVSGDTDDAVLVAGLIDSLSDRLSNLDAGWQSLWVVPGSEVRRLKIEDPQQALQQFGATLAVKGSVNKHGQYVQLNVELIDTKNQRQIGSAELEDTNGDIAALESQAVTRLARLMNLKVPVADTRQASASSSAPAAYENYLTALGYMQRYDKPGNLDQAIGSLQKSIAIDPKFAVSYAELGEAFRLKSALSKDPQWITQAEANCRKSLQLSPDIPAAYVTLGLIHGDKQQALALQEFQHALSLDPHNAAAESGLATIYERLGRLPDAETAFEKAVALQPENWEEYESLGNFYDRQGRHAEAIAQLQHAQQFTPDNTQVMTNLASAEINAGDAKLLPSAEGLLKKAISLNPSYAAYANLGQIYAQDGRYAEAAATTEKALSMDDQDYVVWVNLLNQYEWLKKPDEENRARQRATVLLERAVKANPQDAAAQALLADLYAGLQDKQKALAHIQTTLALTPDDMQNLATIADAYENLGDHQHALAYIQKALQKGLSVQQLKTDPELLSLRPQIDALSQRH
jgi:tetratricopeptide (TPR) repeat protein